MSQHLQEHLLHRFWANFARVVGAVACIWIFALSVRFFVRQEPIQFNILLYSAAATLPEILPYLTLLSAHITILDLHDRQELHLITLMGIHQRQHPQALQMGHPTAHGFHLDLREFLKPLSVYQVKSPLNHLHQNVIDSLGVDRPLYFSNWQVAKSLNNDLFLRRVNEDDPLTLKASLT